MPCQNFNKTDLLLLLPLILLLIIGYYNFLLFHSIIEIISIIIAGLIFLVTFTSRKAIDNTFILIIGASYFFIGFLDLLHTLSYAGLNVFPVKGSNLPTQLWLSARFIESAVLLIALFLLRYRIRFRYIFSAVGLITGLILLSIFYWRNFPDAYIEGAGLTNFKIYGEYAISAALAAVLVFLYRKRHQFNITVYKYLNYAIAFTILTEIVFTFYISVYGAWNILGHILKVISFYFMYKSVAEIGIRAPQEILFNNLKQSKDRLARSEKKYKALFNNMNSGFALFELVHDNKNRLVDYRFMEANKAFLKIISLQGKEIIGRKASQVMAGFDNNPTDWIKQFSQVGEDGKSIKAEQFIPIFQKWLRISAYRPQAGYLAVILEDITKRKQTEKELQDYTERLENITNELFKFQLAVEDASEAIIITDPAMNAVYANKAANQLTGYSNKEITGNSMNFWAGIIPAVSLYVDGDTADIRHIVRQNGHKFDGEVINRRQDGKEIYAYMTISPVYNERKEIIFYVCIERDISKIKEAEKARSEFVYFVSHELKTPLSSILLSIDILFRETAGQIPVEQKEYLDAIKNSADEMSEFIQSLLNVSRIESETIMLNYEPLDLRIEIKDAADELKMQVLDKQISLNFALPSKAPIILMDQKIFKLIILNLLSNAVRYTPKQGKIDISLQASGDNFLFCVSDNGCGIPEEDQDKIFKKLFRSGNALNSRVKGSGLGLYIVKKMTEKIGAKIYFESKENSGSKFYLKIPFSKKLG